MHARRRRTLATFLGSAAITVAASTSGLATQQGPAPKARAGAGAAQAPAPARPADPQAKAPAQPPKATEDPEARRKMDELLKRWEAQSKTVKSLKVEYKRTDVSVLFNAKTEFVGEARLMSPDLVYLDFYEVIDGKQKGAFSERIVCDGKNVYQFLGPPKRIFVYPLDKDAQVKALNQGPLPFLFNMSAAKAKARYHMSFVSENDEAYFIQIIPKLAIDREEYSQALVKLRKLEGGKFLPAKIRLWAPDGKDTKTFDFGGDSLKENVAIGNNWFDGPKMLTELSQFKNPKDPKDRWVVVKNPGPDGKPQGDAPAPRLGDRPAPKAAAPRR